MEKPCIYLILMASLLAGCSSVNMKGAFDSAVKSLNDAQRALGTNLSQSAALPGAPGRRNSLLGTPLHNALKTNISTDGSAPEWPKVVITNLQIPASQRQLAGRSFSLKANECIYFDAVLWHDARHNDRFTNLSLCAPELPKQPNDFVNIWKSFPISGQTTGQVRTEGPTPPYSKLPSDPAMENWLLQQFGLYYVGSLLTLVGYDNNFSIDDRRVWIKNIKQ